MAGPYLVKTAKVAKVNCPAWCWILNLLIAGKGTEKCWCDEKLLYKRETKGFSGVMSTLKNKSAV